MDAWGMEDSYIFCDNELKLGRGPFLNIVTIISVC